MSPTVRHHSLKRDPVYQRGVLGGELARRAQRRRFRPIVPVDQAAAQKPAGFLVGAAEHGCQPVDHVKLGDLADVERNIF